VGHLPPCGWRALTTCLKHKAKLVIAKLDRLSRNVHFISGLMERKVDFVACDMLPSVRPVPNETGSAGGI
jgi:hypothetical protein